MTLTLEMEAPPLRIESNGAIRVGQSRVLLDLVIESYLIGSTPEGIAEQFDTLDIADVYAVVSYYLRHRDEIDAYLAQRRRAGDEIRTRIESEFPSSIMRARLLERRARMTGNGGSPISR